MGEAKPKKHKILGIVKAIVAFLFVGIAATVVTFSIISKAQGNDAVSIFNHQMRIVLTNSMAKDETTDVSKYKIKDIPVNSMVFIEETPKNDQDAYKWYSAIEVGDVLTFKYKYVTQIVITHRVIDIKPTGEGDNKGFIFTLRGDNKGSSDNPGVQTIDTTQKDSYNYVIGKVTGVSVFLGFLFSKTGLCILIMIPSFALLIYEVIKIVRIVSASKKEELAKAEVSAVEVAQEKEKEIEQLKKEIELLKNGQENNTQTKKEDK